VKAAGNRGLFLFLPASPKPVAFFDREGEGVKPFARLRVIPSMLDAWRQDVRYAFRLLRRNPLFALTAAASLAIGIAAATTIFTIGNALLLRPPAGVADPGRVVDIGRSQDGRGFDTSSYPNYLDIRARNTVFSNVHAYNLEPQAMSLGPTAPSGSSATS
jgi:hypothetical protein